MIKLLLPAYGKEIDPKEVIIEGGNPSIIISLEK